MQKFTGYRANSGKIYETAAEALKDDLVTYLTEATSNEAIAATVAAHIISSDFEPLYTILTDMRKEMPTAAPQHPTEKKYYTMLDIRLDDVYIRCMGGSKCDHNPKICTADPAYQTYIQAQRMYVTSTKSTGVPSWADAPTEIKNTWMRKAQDAAEAVK